MQDNQAWITMFRRIPANLHDCLALGLATGAEIVLQKIVKLDPEFMIIRGRLAGTQDTGRVVMIPYTQMTFVAIQRELKDAEVEAMFGQGAPDVFAETPTPSTEKRASEEAPAEQPPSAPQPAKRPASTSKSALVAKLRDRLKDKQ